MRWSLGGEFLKASQADSDANANAHDGMRFRPPSQAVLGVARLAAPHVVGSARATAAAGDAAAEAEALEGFVRAVMTPQARSRGERRRAEANSAKQRRAEERGDGPTDDGRPAEH